MSPRIPKAKLWGPPWTNAQAAWPECIEKPQNRLAGEAVKHEYRLNGNKRQSQNITETIK